MKKILLISLLLNIKFTFNLLNPIFSTEIVGFTNYYIPVIYLKEIPKIERNYFRIINKGDILISEVLFNPRTGSVDFVEIYNHSNHEIDLKELLLANANAAGEPANIKNVSAVKLVIQPGAYWVMTTNQANIKQNYQAKFSTQFVQMSSLPAYNNDKGSVILLYGNLLLDKLDYNAKILHPLIQDDDGISIERVSFDVATNDPNNFKSAAATVGFATPTYKNSQSFSGDENFARLRTKTFSPDGDGFEDTLTLDYQTTENSSLATISIYSDKGILIKKLLKNQTVATSGAISWDGYDDNGFLSKTGIYIILFDVFNLNGNTKRYKNTFVLARKLN